ncbi:MAG TPA: hypothetical protein VK892_01030 [Pyrinomonadaceae bacterium]|nr:hypothetical protein [Pyrinomonadaceae bacterium]
MSKNFDPQKFELLLEWLNPVREEAAEKYEQIRQGLIIIFSSRGCAHPEDLADEVFDRVMNKIEDLKSYYKGKPENYFYGVAKKIRLETFRVYLLPLTEQILADAKIDPDDRETEEIKPVNSCLKQCLKKEGEKNSKMVLEYYGAKSLREKEFHEKLAKKYSMPLNTLRIKVFRIKKRLYKCIKNCLNGE